MPQPLFPRLLLAGALAAAWQSGALAGPAAQTAEVTSLAGLPAQIQADFGVGRQDVISDRGGPFEPGCVMVPGTPAQRFMLAALGADTAVVAVEYGGIMHGASSREYRLVDGKWTVVSEGTPGLNLAGQGDLVEQHARSAQAVAARRR